MLINKEKGESEVKEENQKKKQKQGADQRTKQRPRRGGGGAVGGIPYPLQRSLSRSPSGSGEGQQQRSFPVGRTVRHTEPWRKEGTARPESILVVNVLVFRGLVPPGWLATFL